MTENTMPDTSTAASELVATEAGSSAAPLKTMVLVDGANFLYRSHFAMLAMGRSFSAPDGTPTGALMTFLNMIERLKKLFKPDALAVIFESPTGTFRDKLFDDYKGNRPPTPDEIRIQMRLAKSLCPLLGIPAIWADGFEADDLLCAYGVTAPKNGWRVVLATSDKDINQVVGPNVGVWDPNIHKDETVHTPESVKAKFGVPPELITQYLALMGDSVDNIPGVVGVGTKTAAKFLLKYGSIEGILANSDSFTPALKESFKSAKEVLELALKLSTARLDAPLRLSPEEISALNKTPDWATALPELERLALSAQINKARAGLGLEPIKKAVKTPSEKKAVGSKKAAKKAAVKVETETEEASTPSENASPLQEVKKPEGITPIGDVSGAREPEKTQSRIQGELDLGELVKTTTKHKP